MSEAIEEAATLLASFPDQAEKLAAVILVQAPKDPRALLILASAKRRQGDAAAAHALLVPLARAYPNAARTHYELGCVLADLGQAASAIATLRHAVMLNPDLAEGWRALGDRLFVEGDVDGAEAAYARHALAIVSDPALKAAATALYEKRLQVAEKLLRDHLLTSPHDVQALNMLGTVLFQQERYTAAQIALGRCLKLDSKHDGARFNYARALFRQQKVTEALPHIEQLVQTDPTDAAYRNLLAACLSQIGDDERVNKLYEELLVEYGNQPQIWLNYGHALRAVGRGKEAIEAYRRCLALRPGFADAYLGLANLKVASFTEAEVAAMGDLIEREDLDAEAQLNIRYALGKALEDRREYGPAFDHFLKGGRIRRALAPYHADVTTDQVRRTTSLFTPRFLSARAGSGSAADQPIFIVGLPRSGSTLIEQILASHPAVEGTAELSDIGRIADRLTSSDSPPYPDVLASIDPAEFIALGDSYIETTRIHRKLGRRFFTDKMPNNFLHVGLIQLILPNAKIIDARRHPLGACFSAFKQHFAQGQGFSYDLTDLGRYYADYIDLMAHFDKVLPGRIHRVIYEDMVEDTETEIRRLLYYCGLPFDPACLKFYENDRAVRTVSSEQVRRPIFREGLDQWRRYEPWLGPLKTALGPALKRWRE